MKMENQKKSNAQNTQQDQNNQNTQEQSDQTSRIIKTAIDPNYIKSVEIIKKIQKKAYRNKLM